MANRSFNFIEISANDPQATANFYETLFGWEIQRMPEMDYVTFRAGNGSGGFPAVGQMAKAGDVILYIESDDIGADLGKIEALGGRTTVPCTEIPGIGQYAAFADPTGNQLGLFRPLQP